MPTPAQLQLIHFAARQLWGPSCDASYRVLLRNVADASTAKQLTQTDFEDCMAVMEDLGYHDFRAPRYWRSRVESRSQWANSRMIHLIGELAAESRYDLAAMCERFSAGRTREPQQLRPREAWMLIEAYKAANAREAQAVNEAVKEAEHG